MDFDLNRVPFSRYGSYLAFSVLPALANRPQGLYLRTVHGGATVREIARVEVIRNGRGEPYIIRTSPACLRLEEGGGSGRNLHPHGRSGAPAHPWCGAAPGL